MTLVESRTQRSIMLCALYLAQGVPWGFMLITLPAYLAFQYQVGDDEIGKLTAIILVPWSFKLIWAPIMDTFTIRSLGRRRPWIIGAELMMAASLLGFIGLGNPSEQLRYILWMYFLHNCFASLQDVCTDALAVDILPPDEQGTMNGFMWCSKLIGKGVGAWGLSHVLSFGGLEACVAVQVLILLGIMLVPMTLLERPGERRFPWSARRLAPQPQSSPSDEDSALLQSTTNPYAPPAAESHKSTDDEPETLETATESNVRNPIEVVVSYVRAFLLPTTAVYLVFTLAKLVGLGVNEVVTKTLYTQQLSPKWTDIEYSTAAGLYAMVPIIAGTVLGGILGDRYGRRKVLTVGFGGYGLAALIFAVSPDMWNVRWFAMIYVIACETLYGIGSVGFLSMGMRISWTKSAAIVFTTYMTLSNVSHVLGNWMAGPVRQIFVFAEYGDDATMISYKLTFWFVALTTLAPILLLPFVRPAEVDRAREADGAPYGKSD